MILGWYLNQFVFMQVVNALMYEIDTMNGGYFLNYTKFVCG